MSSSMAGRDRDRDRDESGAGIGGRPAVGRVRRDPAWEGLEPRALLAAALAGGFLTPASATVAKAQAVITGGAAAEFAKYQADLQHAEQSSRVTPAEFADLKADSASVAQDIEIAPLTSQADTQDLVMFQDLVHQSFLDASLKSSPWSQISSQLADALYGVSFPNSAPANQVFTDMQTVARQVRVTPSERQRLLADEKAIDTALGPNVDTTLGDTVARDPVVVYFNGQVTQFVHRR